MVSPLGWYTQRGCMYWCKLGIQGADELNCWMKCYFLGCIYYCWLKTPPAAALPGAQLTWILPSTLWSTNSTHLLKLLKQTQMIILKQNRTCSPHKHSCQQRQLLSQGQLITSTKRAMMSYSSPAFLWANIHFLLLMQEINVQLFCLLLIEKSVS